MSGAIRLDRASHVATVVIDNVAKRNALSQAMWIDLGDIIETLSQEQDLRCIVLRGAGDQAFGSGADIDEFETIRATKEQAIAFARHGHRAMHAVRDCPFPTIAAIQGACVGGGLELAAGCDLRIATDSAVFSVPIARLGATLAYPELQGLVRLVGHNTALEMLLDGRPFDAGEALAKGILTRVVPAASFESELDKTVARVVKNAPLAARWHKQFVARLRDPQPLTSDELSEGYACFDTQDYVEGFSAFLAKRTPHFTGK